MEKRIPEFQFRGSPLSEDNTVRLLDMALTTLNKPELEKPIEQDEVLKTVFGAQIAVKRISVWELPFNISNFFFIASVMTFVNSPGMVVAMLWLAKCYAEKNKKTYLNLSDWCELFPAGTPTEQECSDWWDSQKIPFEERTTTNDNLVDVRELWMKTEGQA